jgi:hypothetical protein
MTPYQKSIAATVLLGLAVVQLIVISLARGWIGGSRPANRRRELAWHRTEGYVALTLIVVVAYYCTRLFPGSQTTRVYIHALLGVTVICLLLAKILIARVYTRFYEFLPYLGATLFLAVVALWISGAGWYWFYSPSGY